MSVSVYVSLCVSVCVSVCVCVCVCVSVSVPQIVELLLERSSQHHIHEAVLQAISAGHIQIAETILKHRRYLDMCKERRKLGDTDGFYKTAYAESQFSPDITPLILAAQKNQYELVQVSHVITK